MIFNFLKSKPKLNNLIPEGFVDIHSHILPGIDDGAKNVQSSLKLITCLTEMGFSKIIGTPHIYEGVHNNNLKKIKNSFDKLINHNDFNKKIKIKYAAEYMLDNSIIEKAEKRNLLCIKDNYVLVEMSYLYPPSNLKELLFILKTNNYNIILAHPERYRFLFDDKSKYFELKKIGCDFQINLLSTIGYYGADILKISDWLIKNNMIEYSGSDIHNKNQLSQFSKKVQLKNHSSLEKILNKNSFFS